MIRFRCDHCNNFVERGGPGTCCLCEKCLEKTAKQEKINLVFNPQWGSSRVK